MTATNLNSYLSEQPLLKKGSMDIEIPNEGIDLEKMVEDLERTLLLKALDKTRGIKKKAAELLHINFRSMRYRLEKYGLNHGEDSQLD